MTTNGGRWERCHNFPDTTDSKRHINLMASMGVDVFTKDHRQQLADKFTNRTVGSISKRMSNVQNATTPIDVRGRPYQASWYVSEMGTNWLSRINSIRSDADTAGFDLQSPKLELAVRDVFIIRGASHIYTRTRNSDPVADANTVHTFKRKQVVQMITRGEIKQFYDIVIAPIIKTMSFCELEYDLKYIYGERGYPMIGDSTFTTYISGYANDPTRNVSLNFMKAAISIVTV